MSGQSQNNLTFYSTSSPGFVYIFDINPSTLDLPFGKESTTIQPLDGPKKTHSLKDPYVEGALIWESILAGRKDEIESIISLVGHTGALVPPSDYFFFGVSFYTVEFTDYEMKLKQTPGQVRYNLVLNTKVKGYV